uniref:Uncharacterized protein n=1 Tax=Panagrolaimus sp. JU765 TaxID=591449 RepID=A0AC34PUX9_9BILA
MNTRNDAQEFVFKIYLHIETFWNFPKFNQHSKENGASHNPASIVVANIKENDQRLKHVEQHRSDRKAFKTLSSSPKLNIIFKCKKF